MPLFDATLSILEQSLDVRLDRQNLLASNLANANTPGYQATDLDFEGQMRSAAQQLESAQEGSFGSQPSPAGGAGSPGSIDELGSELPEESPGLDPISLSLPAPNLPAGAATLPVVGTLGLDGNRVDTDHAMVALAANAINYGAAAKAVAKKLAILSYVANDGQG